MIPVIPDVNNGIRKIPDISIPSYVTNPPSALPILPPVTTQIGVPIVNIPGCVEAHKDSSENQTLTSEDDDGVVTFCDAGAPNFYPIDYDASRIEIKQEAPKPPAYKAPEPKPPAVPKAKTERAIAPAFATSIPQVKDTRHGSHVGTMSHVENTDATSERHGGQYSRRRCM